MARIPWSNGLIAAGVGAADIFLRKTDETNGTTAIWKKLGTWGRIIGSVGAATAIAMDLGPTDLMTTVFTATVPLAVNTAKDLYDYYSAPAPAARVAGSYNQARSQRTAQVRAASAQVGPEGSPSPKIFAV